MTEVSWAGTRNKACKICDVNCHSQLIHGTKSKQQSTGPAQQPAAAAAAPALLATPPLCGRTPHFTPHLPATHEAGGSPLRYAMSGTDASGGGTVYGSPSMSAACPVSKICFAMAVVMPFSVLLRPWNLRLVLRARGEAVLSPAAPAAAAAAVTEARRPCMPDGLQAGQGPRVGSLSRRSRYMEVFVHRTTVHPSCLACHGCATAASLRIPTLSATRFNCPSSIHKVLTWADAGMLALHAWAYLPTLRAGGLAKCALFAAMALSIADATPLPVMRDMGPGEAERLEDTLDACMLCSMGGTHTCVSEQERTLKQSHAHACWRCCMLQCGARQSKGNSSARNSVC